MVVSFLYVGGLMVVRFLYVGGLRDVRFLYVGGLRDVRFLYVGGLVTVLCRRAGGFSDNNAVVAKYNIKLMDVRVDGCDISMLRGLAVVTADG